jgi:hypothetical protein
MAQGERLLLMGVIIGDNIAVPYESRNGKHFWLLFCDKPKHMMTKTFIDAYINTYDEGDSVIQGWFMS